MDDSDRMRRAYSVAGKVLSDRRQASRPDDADALNATTEGEVVVVSGRYDHIGRVFAALGLPFTRVHPQQTPGLDWSRLQVLLVSCPGELPAAALDRIAPWVRGGGYLVTTDWALKNLVERVFPGRVRHNGRQTTDCVVRAETEEARRDPLLDGFLEDGRDPQWWLEGASYPIEVVDQANVRVLIRSRELGEQWGSDAVAVTFDEGEGTVLHMISHLYLQRSECRTARDRDSAAAYLAQCAVDAARADLYEKEAGDLRAAELVSAMSSARVLENVLLAKKRGSTKGRS